MKEILIKIQGFQYTPDSDEEDSIELTTDGEYLSDNGVVKFSYMESELTGFEGTKTSFVIDDKRVVMTREGNVNSEMIFDEAKKHLFAYDTPYGAVTMGVETQNIVSSLNEDGGDLEIRYVIDLNNSILSRNAFKINIKTVAE